MNLTRNQRWLASGIFVSLLLASLGFVAGYFGGVVGTETGWQSGLVVASITATPVVGVWVILGLLVWIHKAES